MGGGPSKPPDRSSMQRRYDVLAQTLPLPKELLGIVTEYAGRSSVMYLAGSMNGIGGHASRAPAPLLRNDFDVPAVYDTNAAVPNGVWSIHHHLSDDPTAAPLLAVSRSDGDGKTKDGQQPRAAIFGVDFDPTTATTGARAATASATPAVSMMGVLTSPAPLFCAPHVCVALDFNNDPMLYALHISPERGSIWLTTVNTDVGAGGTAGRTIARKWTHTNATGEPYRGIANWRRNWIVAWSGAANASSSAAVEARIAGGGDTDQCQVRAIAFATVSSHAVGQVALHAADVAAAASTGTVAAAVPPPELLQFNANEMVALGVVHDTLFVYGAAPADGPWNGYRFYSVLLNAHAGVQTASATVLRSRRCADPPTAGIRGRTLVPSQDDHQLYLIGSGLPICRYDITTDEWTELKTLIVGGEYRSAVAMPEPLWSPRHH